MHTRPAAVAGRFYPGDEEALRHQIDGFLRAVDAKAGPPKAMVGPHAGTIYSGPIAATAYARLMDAPIERVVLLGPSHRVPLRGVAASTAQSFETPLGRIPVDRVAIDTLLRLPQVVERDDAHAREHSLELHLPFLQRVLPPFSLVPLVVGATPPEHVEQVLDMVWGGPETLIVVSSDLSHFEDYDTASRIDRETSDMIAQLRWSELDGRRACGAYPLRGLLRTAKRRRMEGETIDLRNSGDTAGRRGEVVGYGAYVFD